MWGTGGEECDVPASGHLHQAQQRGSAVVWGLSDKIHKLVLAKFPHKKATDQFHVAEWHANQSDCFQQGFKKTKQCFQTSRYCSLVKLDFPALHMSSGFVPLHFILLGTLMFLLCTAALGLVSHLWSIQRISALLLCCPHVHGAFSLLSAEASGMWKERSISMWCMVQD